MRLLVTACLGPSGRSILRLLRDEPGVDVVGIDAARGDVPPGDAPGYVEALAQWLDGVDWILPTSDEEAWALAGHPKALLSAPEVVRRCLDKGVLYVSVGPGLAPVAIVGGVRKPRRGSGGQGVARLEECDVVTEYLPGPEYTVDALCWRGEIVAAVARRRDEVADGISMVGTVLAAGSRPEHVARAVAARVGPLTGCVAIQCRADARGIERVTDVNLRPGGGVTITAAAGVNLLVLLVRVLRDEPFTIPAAVPGTYESWLGRDGA